MIKKVLTGQWFEFDGSSYKIRPWPLSKAIYRAKVNENGTGSAELDLALTNKEQFVYCLEDWNLEDAEGKPAPCTDEWKSKVYDFGLIPAEHYLFILEKIAELGREIEDTGKNLNASQDGTSSKPKADMPDSTVIDVEQSKAASGKSRPARVAS